MRGIFAQADGIRPLAQSPMRDRANADIRYQMFELRNMSSPLQLPLLSRSGASGIDPVPDSRFPVSLWCNLTDAYTTSCIALMLPQNSNQRM